LHGLMIVSPEPTWPRQATRGEQASFHECPCPAVSHNAVPFSHVACRHTLTLTSPSNSPTAIQGCCQCVGSLVCYKSRREGNLVEFGRSRRTTPLLDQADCRVYECGSSELAPLHKVGSKLACEVLGRFGFSASPSAEIFMPTDKNRTTPSRRTR
jgi:hypothetical protein